VRSAGDGLGGGRFVCGLYHSTGSSARPPVIEPERIRSCSSGTASRIAGNQPGLITHRGPDLVDHAILLQLAEQRRYIQRMSLVKGQLNRHV